MLSCIVGNKSVNSFDYEEAKLRAWSNKGILRCPECEEKVIYCNGDYKIPYFKHEVGSECSGNSYYEPMTEEHINGIKMLYNRLKEIDEVQNLEVEKYIKNTKQRPDIYFEYKGDRYCIEYQCSPISTQYNKRHELYQFEGINDIWILGTEKYNFEAFIETDKYIKFKEKSIKTIEDEVDRCCSPLLYLKDEVILKVDKNGFIPILRDKYKYFYKNSPLKKTVGLLLDKHELNDVNMNILTTKNNLNVKETIKKTKETIKECEEIVLTTQNTYGINVLFGYNLLVDRFPMYLYNVKSSYYSKYKDWNRVCFNHENVVDNFKEEVKEIIEKDCLIKYLKSENNFDEFICNEYELDFYYDDFVDVLTIAKYRTIIHKLHCREIKNISEFKDKLSSIIDKINKIHPVLNKLRSIVQERYKIDYDYIYKDYIYNKISYTLYIHQHDEILEFDIYYDESQNNTFKTSRCGEYKIMFNGDYESLSSLFNGKIADEIRRVRYGQV